LVMIIPPIFDALLDAPTTAIDSGLRKPFMPPNNTM
jgi:hypothetical protein